MAYMMHRVLPADLAPHHSGVIRGVATTGQAVSLILSPTIMGFMVSHHVSTYNNIPPYRDIQIRLKWMLAGRKFYSYYFSVFTLPMYIYFISKFPTIELAITSFLNVPIPNSRLQLSNFLIGREIDH